MSFEVIAVIVIGFIVLGVILNAVDDASQSRRLSQIKEDLDKLEIEANEFEDSMRQEAGQSTVDDGVFMLPWLKKVMESKLLSPNRKVALCLSCLPPAALALVFYRLVALEQEPPDWECDDDEWILFFEKWFDDIKQHDHGLRDFTLEIASALGANSDEVDMVLTEIDKGGDDDEEVFRLGVFDHLCLYLPPDDSDEDALPKFASDLALKMGQETVSIFNHLATPRLNNLELKESAKLALVIMENSQ